MIAPIVSDVTRFLESARQGDAAAASKLLALVYDELRKLAAHRMAGERPGQTLQATALVHEAWLNIGGANPQWQNRAHFFGAAAEAMRRILIDRARWKMAARHGGGQERVNVEDIEIAAPSGNEDELLAVHGALDQLAAEDPTKAELVKLRFFAGLTLEEAGAVMGVSERTAKRHWAYAKAWLYDFIRNGG
jgi:RNA polymerase sigma factor (TIGR02999 family)